MLILAPINVFSAEGKFNAASFDLYLLNPEAQSLMHMYASGVVETILMYEDDCKDLGIIATEKWVLEKWNIGVKYLLSQKQDLRNYSVSFVFRASIAGQCSYLKKQKSKN